MRTKGFQRNNALNTSCNRKQTILPWFVQLFTGNEKLLAMLTIHWASPSPCKCTSQQQPLFGAICRGHPQYPTRSTGRIIKPIAYSFNVYLVPLCTMCPTAQHNGRVRSSITVVQQLRLSDLPDRRHATIAIIRSSACLPALLRLEASSTYLARIFCSLGFSDHELALVRLTNRIQLSPTTATMSPLPSSTRI
jgi:hypothetical protein